MSTRPPCKHSCLPSGNVNKLLPPNQIKKILRSNKFSLIWGCSSLVCGIILLLWNEGKAVQSAHSLQETLNTVIALNPSFKIDPKNNGRLVHITGSLEVGEPLTEMEYGVSVPAVKLKRRVQMYQWIEEQMNVVPDYGDVGLPKYNYYTEWKDKLIDSSRFHEPTGHHNPKSIPFRSTVYISTEVRVGPFLFSKELKDRFNDFVLVTSDERPDRRDIRMHSGLYYHSQDVWNPEVGDIRVQFSYAGKAGDVVSVVGMQNDNEIQPFQMSDGREILILQHGISSMAEILHEEHIQNIPFTWMFRVGGWFLVFQGSSYLTSVIQIMLCYGQTPPSTCLSLAVCLVVVAAVWLQYRPLFAIGLATLAVFPLVWSSVMAGYESNGDHKLNEE